MSISKSIVFDQYINGGISEYVQLLSMHRRAECSVYCILVYLLFKYMPFKRTNPNVWYDNK